MTDFDQHDYDDEELEPVKSRTQIKKEMEALQAIGKKLCELNDKQLEQVPMGEDLRHAIDLYRHNITQKEARRRQMQYIGKLMRSEEVEEIQQALDKFDSSSKVFTQALHQAENWRDRLLKGGNSELTEFVKEFPSVDVQHLRQIVRNAQKDLKNNKNTGAAKKLFQIIRGNISLD